jgi:hypothetical protein
MWFRLTGSLRIAVPVCVVLYVARLEGVGHWANPRCLYGVGFVALVVPVCFQGY